MAGSILLTNSRSFSTNANPFINNPTKLSVSFFCEFDQLFPAGQNSLIWWGGVAFLISYNQSGVNGIYLAIGTSGANQVQYFFVPVLGVTYYVLGSWQVGGSSFLQLSGSIVATGTPIAGLGNTSPISFGWGPSSAVGFRVAKLAIWNGYAATASDGIAIRGGADPTTIGLGSGTMAYWTMDGTPPNHPQPSDTGLQNSGTASGQNFTTSSGTAANATYSTDLVYSPPTTPDPYIVKSGKLVAFFTFATGTNILQAVTAVNNDPTIQAQFGGTGTPQTVQIQGPLYEQNKLPIAFYNLLCGSIQEIVVQDHGAGYISPTASLSGGSPITPAVLGTPVLSGGVTSYAVTGGGTGYTSPP